MAPGIEDGACSCVDCVLERERGRGVQDGNERARRRAALSTIAFSFVPLGNPAVNWATDHVVSGDQPTGRERCPHNPGCEGCDQHRSRAH